MTLTPASPIEYLGLPTRAYTALVRAGISTLGQLLPIRYRLTHVPGIGVKTAEEVEVILGSLPLSA